MRSKRIKKIIHSFLFSAFFVPLSNSSDWQQLSYRKIPANKVQFSDGTIKILVDKSAGPLIYPLKETIKLQSIRAKIKVSPLPGIKLPPNVTQGEKDYDDFVFRLGLVKEGARKLNWLERQIAAPWVLKLYSLAPPDTGLDQVHFLVATNQESLLNKSRIHPLSDLLTEEYITVVKDKNPIILEKKFDVPQKVAALWVASDGDFTKSKFTVEILEIEINYEK